MPESSRFKLSVWREFIPPSALLLSAKASDDEPPSLGHREYVGAGNGLQCEIYSWRMPEDAFGGVADAPARSELEELLLKALAIASAPSDRDIASLQRFTTRAREIIDVGCVEWSGSQSVSDDAGEGVRLNPLLALVNHLEWIAEVFDEQPHVSVTVR